MPSFAAPTVEFMGEMVLLQGLHGGRGPGSACEVLAARGNLEERGEAWAAVWADRAAKG